MNISNRLVELARKLAGGVHMVEVLMWYLRDSSRLVQVVHTTLADWSGLLELNMEAEHKLPIHQSVFGFLPDNPTIS